MKKIYNKLVRYNIPNILEKKGISFKIKKVSDKFEIKKLLDEKLKEEKIWEIADIIEVLKSISWKNNISWEEVEKHRQQKYDERGWFQEWIVLISTEEK